MKRTTTTWLTLLILLTAAPALAIETDILFGSGNVKPNVLILYDNSGSMANQPGYDPAQTYTGSYDPTLVYHRCKRYWSNCSCRTTQSTWVTTTGGCGFVDNNGDGVDDRTSFKQIGNRRNWETNVPNKIEIARSVINSMLLDTANQNMRFGLMLYNGNYNINSGNLNSTSHFMNYHTDSSVLRTRVQDDNHANMITLVNAAAASGGTPSANRMIQAGQYFAGDLPGHPSPIQYSCQRNYIINITDGIPEAEGQNLAANYTGHYPHIESWLQSKLGSDIDPDDDGADPDPTATSSNCQSCGRYINGGSDYMDDVAWVLQHHDLMPNMEGQQNVTTFTIGFDIAHQLLADTAQNGGGRYFESTDSDTLADALRKTLNLIATDAQSFVAPVVPVNALKRTQSGDRLYIALFQPIAASNFWAGNIKKYGIDDDGDLTSPDGTRATNDTGTILSTARSFFDIGPSGGAVTRGGVGEVLLNRAAARKIYTYLGNVDLTAGANAFTVANTTITKEHLGLATDPERDALIDFLHGKDSYDDDNDSNLTEKRDWILGDFIHSTPLVVTYGENERVIIAGANDGMLHAFDDGTGEELWAFLPPSVLPRLKDLIPGEVANHPFLVDGSPRFIKTDTNQLILVFGMRRGGSDYYALDITNKTAPRFLWTINSSTSGFGELGQAWSEPIMGKLDESTYVALFGGGYDTYFDDPVNVGANPTGPKGRALYAVNAETGALISAITVAGMEFPIPSNISALDASADGTFDIAYVGDLGGNMWRWQLPSTVTKIFTAPANRKIFHSPDIVLQHGYIGVFFGTGDLANPLEELVTNRLYALKDDGLTGGHTEANLIDVTANLGQDGTAAQKAVVQEELTNSRGWYIRLTRTGEKALASPLVFFDVFFTTFLPNAEVCSGGGDSFLYSLDFENGGATVDFSGNGQINASDRSLDIGSSIPTELTLTIREQSAIGYVGVGGAIPRIDLPSPPLNVVPLYWREMY
jgi:type IV pilus assembly protein PilY1